MGIAARQAQSKRNKALVNGQFACALKRTPGRWRGWTRRHMVQRSASGRQRALHFFGPLLLPLINRAVEDLVRNRVLVNDLPRALPFHELRAATKLPNNRASREIGD